MMPSYISDLDLNDFGTRVCLGFFTFRTVHVIVDELLLNKTSNYSKFFSPQDSLLGALPSKRAMTILYAAPFFTGVYYIIQNPASVCAWMCMAHFAKRLAEVSFLHKYSGKMDLFTSVAGSGVYSFGVFARCAYAQPSSSSVSATSVIGLAAFVVGELGNLYHHALLARAKRGEDNKYTVPTGGLFPLVACPHYLFEIIAMFGIACYGRNALGYYESLVMFMHLALRSAKTTKYYKQAFGDEYPSSRKNLIPYIW